MKEFQISKDLKLRKAVICGGSCMGWYLMRYKEDQFKVMRIVDFVILSEDEAITIATKILAKHFGNLPDNVVLG